jgi:hypothetical protein
MDPVEAGGWLLLIVAAAFAIYLMTRLWFWLWLFFLGALASAFATLASIIHFQILGAVGFFILMSVCWGVFKHIIVSTVANELERSS